MNKYGKILEYSDLIALGCTPEAVELKYNGSDSKYFEKDGIITEAIRGVEFVCAFPVAEFVEIFNNPNEPAEA